MYNSTLVFSENSVDYAFGKLENFVRLNRADSSELKLDSLHRLCQALGLSENIIVTLYAACIDRYDEMASYIFVGTLLGLAIAEHGIENYDQNT